MSPEPRMETKNAENDFTLTLNTNNNAANKRR